LPALDEELPLPALDEEPPLPVPDEEPPLPVLDEDNPTELELGVELELGEVPATELEDKGSATAELELPGFVLDEDGLLAPLPDELLVASTSFISGISEQDIKKASARHKVASVILENILLIRYLHLNG